MIHMTIPPINRAAPDDVQALQIFADDFGQQERRNRGDHECDGREAQRVRQERPVAPFASGKRGQKFRDALTEIYGQAGDGAQLDHDRVHFPIAARQADVHQRFGDAQMRGRADGKKFR